MAGSSNSRGHWDVGKSAKKARKQEKDSDEPFASLSASPAGNATDLRQNAASQHPPSGLAPLPLLPSSPVPMAEGGLATFSSPPRAVNLTGNTLKIMIF